MNFSEAKISAKRANVKFTKADENTPYIKNMIQKIADITNKGYDAELQEIKRETKEFVEGLGDSDKFYSVQKQNPIETIVFRKLNDLSDKLDTEKFNEEIFYYMFKAIIAKNRAFLKIRDIFTGKRVKFNIILTPAPSFIKQPDWVKSVTTAAASPEGDVIFNKKFAQQLLDYAELKGEKPKGAMYKSNGGKVPDSYAYIEFLILHEIYHIIHADHFQQVNKKGMTPLMQNYLGDFITNYNLIKAGYPQPPIALFSGDFNYDKYDTMNDMQNDIIKEFEKLSDKNKEDLNKQMDNHMDRDHKETNGEDSVENDEPSDGNPQDNPENKEDKQKDSQDNQNSQSQDSQDQDSQSSQSSQDTQDQDNQSGETQDQNMDDSFKDKDNEIVNADDKMSQEDLEKAMKEVQDEKNQENNLSAEERQKMLDKERTNREKREKELKDMDANYVPIMWKKLIKQMIPKPIEVDEESMSRIHRRTRGQLALGKKITAVKAGTIKSEEASQDMLFILDSSGSMLDIINNISQDLIKLINQNKSYGIKNMYIIRFDSSWDVYRVYLDMNGKKHTFQAFQNKKDLLKDPDNAKMVGSPKPLKSLFQMSWGAGTDFPPEILKIIKIFQQKKINQVMFTDSDIIWSKNVDVLQKACKLGIKKPYSFNLILNNKNTFNSVADALGTKYKYMSYLK